MEETEEIEILWIEVKSGQIKTYIGVYYGLQENTKKEEVEEQMNTIRTQILQLQQKGNVILTGDFNAKLEVKNPTKNIEQKESRNGKLLRELIQDTSTTAINTQTDVCDWTRENRNNHSEKSIIDYVLVPSHDKTSVKEIRVDTQGSHRLEGAKQTDHNTIIMTLDLTIQYKMETKTTWKHRGPEIWDNFNKQTIKNIKEQNPTTYDHLESIIMTNLNDIIGRKTQKGGKNRETSEVKEKRE